MKVEVCYEATFSSETKQENSQSITLYHADLFPSPIVAREMVRLQSQSQSSSAIYDRSHTTGLDQSLAEHIV